MTDQLWEHIAYIAFGVNTLCLIETVDLVMFHKPVMTLFLVIFAACAFMNWKIYEFVTKKRV